MTLASADSGVPEETHLAAEAAIKRGRRPRFSAETER
jgi:hypothetical protein